MLPGSQPTTRRQERLSQGARFARSSATRQRLDVRTASTGRRVHEKSMKSTCASKNPLFLQRQHLYRTLDRLTCERVGPDLELRDLALRAFAALDVPDEVRPVIRVQRATLPAGAGVVDPAVHPA